MFHDRSVLVTLIAGCLVFVPLFAVLARRAGWSRWRVAGAAAAGIGLAGALALTWGRWFVVGDPSWRGCETGTALTVHNAEAVLNWLVLMPAAFFAMLAWQRLRLVLLVCLGVPVVIELVQSVAALGVCQAADVVRNGGGAVVAAVFAGILMVAIRPAPPTSAHPAG
jgi:hypothetical protein